MYRCALPQSPYYEKRYIHTALGSTVVVLISAQDV